MKGKIQKFKQECMFDKSFYILFNFVYAFVVVMVMFQLKLFDYYRL